MKTRKASQFVSKRRQGVLQFVDHQLTRSLPLDLY